MIVPVSFQRPGRGPGGHAWLFVPFGLAWLVLVQPARAVEAPLRPATATIDDLRRAVEARRERIVSLRAVYTSWFRENLGTSRCEHYVVAAKGRRRYALLWHGEHANPQEDPRANIQLLDGEHWNAFNPCFRYYEISRRFAVPPYTDKIHLHPLFEGLGWWPPGDPGPPTRARDRRVFFHDVLADDRCRVLGQESIDGTWCHVVELPGTDRLWVDATRGTGPRRREAP